MEASAAEIEGEGRRCRGSLVQVCSIEYCPEATVANGAEFAASHRIIYLCTHYFYGLRTFEHKNDARIYMYHLMSPGHHGLWHIFPILKWPQATTS